jgi:hypothetical protein
VPRGEAIWPLRGLREAIPDFSLGLLNTLKGLPWEGSHALLRCYAAGEGEGEARGCGRVGRQVPRAGRLPTRLLKQQAGALDTWHEGGQAWFGGDGR